MIFSASSKVQHRPPFVSGAVLVVTGPMFSGKTEALLSSVRRSEDRGRSTGAFYPAVDSRTDSRRVASHRGDFVSAKPFRMSTELLGLFDSDPTEVVVIDEAQFSDASLPGVVDGLRRRGITVYCAGLDTDFLGRPFGPMPALIAIADTVESLLAICPCGSPASMTQRVDAVGEAILVGAVVEVGGAGRYEARCSECFVSPTTIVPTRQVRSGV